MKRNETGVTAADRSRAAAARAPVKDGRLGVLRAARGWVGGGWPALVPTLLFLPIVLAPPLNHDVAAVLDFSRRWFAGEHLYSDLIDVNPPLIFVLTLIPVAISRASGIGDVLAVQLCLLALGAVVAWVAWRVRDRVAEGRAERVLLDVLPLLFLLDAGYDFGQREHLMALLAVPYLLCSARRAESIRPRGSVAAGVLAGLGFALKPHFLGVPCLVEIAVLAARARWGWWPALRRTVRDPLLWAVAAVWTAYAISLPLVFSDYLDVVVPLAWSLYVDLGGLSALQVLLVPRMAIVLALLLPTLAVALRQPFRSGRPLPHMLGLAALGSLASAVAQHKGWSYHIVPIELFALALATLLAARWIDAHGVVRTARGAGRVGAILGGLFALYAVSNGEAPWREIDYSRSTVTTLVDKLDEVASGERVLVLSPAIYPIYPALNYSHARMTLRSMNMWLLEGAYAECLPDGRRYREMWEMGRTEFFVFRTVAEDFARAPPAAVLVDKQPGIPWCGSEFDFIAYFSRHPLFAEVWSHYRLVSDWDRYKLYVRE